VLIINETLCKNNLNSVKDVAMIYVSVEGEEEEEERKKETCNNLEKI